MFDINANFDVIEAQLAKFESETLPKIYTVIMITAVKEFYVRVVIYTPRDTGYAQNSWDVSLNDVGSYLPTQGKGSYDVPNISCVMKLKDTLKLGDSIVVYSLVPYMNRLNHGWSQRAPIDFIGKALAESQAAVNSVGNIKIT